MGNLYVNNILPTTGSLVTIRAGAETTGDIKVNGEVQTANIGYTDGDNSMTIADGGKVTFAAGFAVGSDAAGDVLYHNGTSYVRLAKGSDDEVLTLASGLPSWAASAANMAFIIEDDDGTEISVSNGEEIKIIGSGVTTNWTDTTPGSDADPFDLTITVDAAQTGITSIYNTSLKVGRDADNLVDFATTDNKLIFRVQGVDEVELVQNALEPVTNDGVALGTTSLGWSDLHIATGGVINWANGEMTITETANDLAIAGGTVTVDGGVKVDNITIDGTEIDLSSGDLTFDVAGDIILDAAGNEVLFKPGGTLIGGISNSSSDLVLSSSVTNKDIKFIGSDNNSAVTALTLDMSEAGAASFNSTVTATGFTIGSAAITEAELEIIDGATVTTTELNLLDGDTSVGTSITIGDTDGFIVNDGGTMKTIPASDIKTYTGGGTTFVIEDDDGTEISVSDGEEIKIIGSGVTTNWTDTTPGSDADPFDLTITVDAAQTGITSILATNVKIGEDDQTKIDFETEDEIHFYAANVHQVKLVDNAFTPQADSDVDLGASGTYWKDAFIDTITTTGDVDVLGNIELGHTSDTTLSRASSGDVNIEGNIIYRAGGTDVPVADGGTGASSLTDGGVLLGSGTGAITAMAVLADGEMIVGDGTTDPVAESGATLRTSIGVGTGDSPQFTGIELGHASDTTITRTGSGAIAVEGTAVLLAGAQTGVTTILNTGTKIGRDAHNLIDFTTDDTITFRVANVDEVAMVANVLQPVTNDGCALGSTDLGWSDLFLADGGTIKFGDDQDVVLTHVADTGLILKHTATGDDKPVSLTIQTGETTLIADEVLGKIDFQAPDEASGTDSQLVAAGIEAIAEGAFSSSSNACKLSFKTASSEAASEKMSLSSAGLLTVSGDLSLKSDSSVIKFGANEEVTLTHEHDVGLILTHTATIDNTTVRLTLKSEEDDIAADEVIAAIDFKGGDSGGTDAILVCAGIEAVATDTHAADNNATKLSFKTAASEAAAEKMSLSPTGVLTLNGSSGALVIPNAGTIGSASDTDAIAISSGGAITLSSIAACGSDVDKFLVSNSGVVEFRTGAEVASDIGAVALGNANTFTADQTIGGTTPKLTIGDGGAEDSMLAFDGNAVDFHISLDDTADDLVIGTGTTAGSNTAIMIDGGGTLDTTFYGHVKLVDDKAIYLGTNDDYVILYDESTHDTINIGANVADADFKMKLYADANEAAGDAWLFTIADGGTLTLGNDKNSHATYVTHLTITPNATVTDSTAAFAGNVSVATACTPDASDGATLGTAALEWADLYLADEATIQFGDDQDVVLTHVADSGLTLEASGASSKPVFELKNTNNDATGAILKFNKDGANAADDDVLGDINFVGENDAGSPETITYAYIRALSEDVSDGSEDGSIILNTMVAGTARSIVTVGNGAGVVLPNDSTYGTIKANAFITYSDETLKHDIMTLENPLDKVLSMRGVSYAWNSDNKADIGFIAQEIQDIVPEVVYKSKNQETYGIDYASITALLVEAVKEQQNQIEDLKSTIKDLKN